MSSPAVTMGPIPSSTSVPCCDAKITLANARKSNSGVVAPNRGVWPMTMYMRSATPHHKSRVCKVSFFFGFGTCGR